MSRTGTGIWAFGDLGISNNGNRKRKHSDSDSEDSYGRKQKSLRRGDDKDESEDESEDEEMKEENDDTRKAEEKENVISHLPSITIYWPTRNIFLMPMKNPDNHVLDGHFFIGPKRYKQDEAYIEFEVVLNAKTSSSPSFIRITKMDMPLDGKLQETAVIEGLSRFCKQWNLILQYHNQFNEIILPDGQKIPVSNPEADRLKGGRSRRSRRWYGAVGRKTQNGRRKRRHLRRGGGGTMHRLPTRGGRYSRRR